MSRNYYYLVSSLYDLLIDSTTKGLNLPSHLELCEELLIPEDFQNLKSLFLLNDCQNVIQYHRQGDPYLTPSYYSEEEFLENLKDPDGFLPFIAEYFYNQKTEKRIQPDLLPIDELILLFFEGINFLTNPFVKNYYLFELDLKNITTALSLRKNNLVISSRIIPFGEAAEHILSGATGDFGLQKATGYIDKLLTIYDSNDLIKLERTIDDIRWEWLDENSSHDHFSLITILAYTVKLISVTRWMHLSVEKGKAMLDQLIQQIKNNIQFPSEFINLGGKQ